MEPCTNNISALYKSVYCRKIKITSLRVRLEWIRIQIERLLSHLKTFANPTFLDDLTSTKEDLGVYMKQYEEVQREFCVREIKLMHLHFKLCCLKVEDKKMHKIKVETICKNPKNSQKDNTKFICLDTVDISEGISQDIHTYFIERGHHWHTKDKKGLVNAFFSIMNKIKTKQNGNRAWYELNTSGNEIHVFNVSSYNNNKSSKKENIVSFFSNKKINFESAKFIAVNWLLQSDLFLFP